MMEKGKERDLLSPAVGEDDAAEKKRKSFERSLAGQSVNKAGLVLDQTEINRVIAEASKGSKFYRNQVRKDEILNEKIAWFQNKRDEVMRTANAARLEAQAETILAEVEATRDLSQTIIHVDMDAFYASVEVQRDPSLEGKPFGVGEGVLTTASYEARKFGCRSAMPGFIAKKLCPHIILTPLHFDLYIAASKSVREVLLKYDENLMMASLDEGYLNITPYMSEHDMSAGDVVSQLRKEVEEATGLTISAGIAPNRMLAKICSDKNKPNGQYELERDRIAITRFMRDMPVRKIPGYGRVTERCLEGLGVETCGDIWTHRATLLAMNHWFGFRGLCQSYLGISDNKVAPGKREERKSVGVERTFRDKSQEDDILAMLAEIADELEKDLKGTQYAGKTVTVKYKMHTFENKTRARSVGKYLTTAEEILPIATELLKKELPLRIRLLGIRISNLKDLTQADTGIKKFFSASAPASSSKESTPVPAILEDEEDEEPDWEETDFIPASRPIISAKMAEKQITKEALLATNASANIAAPSGSSSATRPNQGTASTAASTAPKPAPVKRKSSGSEPPTSTRTHLLGPTCPICSKALGPGTSNQGLNDHIDWCLNRDAIADASQPSPKKVKLGQPAPKKPRPR